MILWTSLCEKLGLFRAHPHFGSTRPSKGLCATYCQAFAEFRMIDKVPTRFFTVLGLSLQLVMKDCTISTLMSFIATEPMAGTRCLRNWLLIGALARWL